MRGKHEEQAKLIGEYEQALAEMQVARNVYSAQVCVSDVHTSRYGCSKHTGTVKRVL